MAIRLSWGYLVGGGAALAVLGLAVVYAGLLAEPPGIDRADASNVELVALGEGLYRSECAACHGARLDGQANWRSRLPDGSLPAPPHDETGHTWHHPDALLFDVTKFGGAKNAPPGFVSRMPAFGEKLKDREIWAVLSYIKSAWPDHVRQRQAMIDERVRAQGK